MSPRGPQATIPLPTSRAALLPGAAHFPGRSRLASGRFASLLGAALFVLGFASAPTPAAAETLSLADAVRIASGGSAQVELAKLNEDEARARRAQARGVLFPTITGTASDYNRTASLKAQGFAFSFPGAPPFPEPIGPFESFDARLRARQALLDISGLQHVRAADFAERQAREDHNASAETAAQQAAAAYLRATRAQAVLAAREADVRIASDLLGIAEAQQQAGTAPRIDRTRAQTALAAQRGQVLVARNQFDRALLDLARALGRPPGTTLALADTLGGEIARSDAPEVETTATGVAYERRPELASQRARESSARVERSAISSERLPRIEAAGDWGRAGANAEHSVSTRSYGVELSMPFLDGFRREARLAEQSSVIEATQVRTRDLREQIAAEVQAALLDLSSGRSQLDVAQERLDLALEELAEARERFVSGVAGNIEIINAQASVVGARDTEIEARFAIASARVALARATGVARTLR